MTTSHTVPNREKLRQTSSSVQSGGRFVTKSGFDIWKTVADHSLSSTDFFNERRVTQYVNKHLREVAMAFFNELAPLLSKRGHYELELDHGVKHNRRQRGAVFQAVG
jgi:hypothetical protein